jgi:hypothetical protein
MMFAATPHSDFDGSSSAYQSMLDLALCPQRFSPFDFCGLPSSATEVTSSCEASDLPSGPMGRLVSVFPFEGLSLEAASRRHVAATAVASREVGCSSEFCKHRGTRPVGLAESRSDLAVSSGPCGIAAGAGPRSLAITGSSSRELLLLFRVRATSRLPPVRRPVSSSRGVSSSFATQAQGVHFRQASQACLRSARSVSHALGGLLLPAPWGLISSPSHVRGLSTGVFLDS